MVICVCVCATKGLKNTLGILKYSTSYTQTNTYRCEGLKVVMLVVGVGCAKVVVTIPCLVC